MLTIAFLLRVLLIAAGSCDLWACLCLDLRGSPIGVIVADTLEFDRFEKSGLDRLSVRTCCGASRHAIFCSISS